MLFQYRGRIIASAVFVGDEKAKNAEIAAIAELVKPCGIFAETAGTPPVEHVDYPHTPGTLYDCPACEAACLCTGGFQCVHCALAAEQVDGTAEGGDDQ